MSEFENPTGLTADRSGSIVPTDPTDPIDAIDPIEIIMKNQPTFSVGFIGNVADGKSTIAEKISGEKLTRFSSEQEKGITIRLGYANAKIWKCLICDPPQCYKSSNSSLFEMTCRYCDTDCELLRHISFVDCPGHNMLMATMLNGTAAMNYCILIESATNDKMPSDQSIEHFNVTQKSGIPTCLVCVNKMDLVIKSKEKNIKLLSDMRKFLEDNSTDKIPVIPVSAIFDANIDVICEYLGNLPQITPDLTKDFKMLIIRSFNVNKPHTKIQDLKGGVVGGTLVRGVLSPGTKAIIYPGYVTRHSDQEYQKTGRKWKYAAIKCSVISIKSDDNELTYAISGGLIGVQLDIDPGLSGNDKLVGQVMFRKTEIKTKIHVYETLTVQYHKLNDETQISNVKIFHINANGNNLRGDLESLDEINNVMTLNIEKPVCVEIGDNITINIPISNGGINIFAKGVVIGGVSCHSR